MQNFFNAKHLRCFHSIRTTKHSSHHAGRIWAFSLYEENQLVQNILREHQNTENTSTGHKTFKITRRRMIKAWQGGRSRTRKQLQRKKNNGKEKHFQWTMIITWRGG